MEALRCSGQEKKGATLKGPPEHFQVDQISMEVEGGPLEDYYPPKYRAFCGLPCRFAACYWGYWGLGFLKAALRREFPNISGPNIDPQEEGCWNRDTHNKDPKIHQNSQMVLLGPTIVSS